MDEFIIVYKYSNKTIIKIKVPKDLWFDTLHVECEKYYDDNTSIIVRFLVTNGFLTNKHTDFCSNLEEILKDDLESRFNEYESADDYEFRGCNDAWMLERKDAVEEDGTPHYQGVDTSFLVATLTAAIQEQQALIESLTTTVNSQAQLISSIQEKLGS